MSRPTRSTVTTILLVAALMAAALAHVGYVLAVHPPHTDEWASNKAYDALVTYNKCLDANKADSCKLPSDVKLEYGRHGVTRLKVAANSGNLYVVRFTSSGYRSICYRKPQAAEPCPAGWIEIRSAG